MPRKAAILVLFSLCVLLARPSRLAQALTKACTEGGVASAFTTGGSWTFSCIGPTTVTLTSTTNVNLGIATTLDGQGL